MNTEFEILSSTHGLMLTDEDNEFMNCCMKCEVASSLSSIDKCPQRVNTSNSCCPSCGQFIEHGLKAMLSHWGNNARFLIGFQIVIPFRPEISEDIIRKTFHLKKVPSDRLNLIYERKDGRSFDIIFSKQIEWVMIIRQNYWPLDLDKTFLRDGLIYGLAGLSEHAGAEIFTDLQELIDNVISRLRFNFKIIPTGIFILNSSHKTNLISYYASFFLQFENQMNQVVEIVAPDYEISSDSEICLVRREEGLKAFTSFAKITKSVILQTELLTSWSRIEPELNQMLVNLVAITTKMDVPHQKYTISLLNDLLEEVQSIQIKILKIKPRVANLQGVLPPLFPLISDPLIQALTPNLNVKLIDTWFDYVTSVERSVEQTNSYIRTKLNLLTLKQEKRIMKRLNWVTVAFATITGIAAATAFFSGILDRMNNEGLGYIEKITRPYADAAMLLVVVGILIYIYLQFFHEKSD